MNVRRRVAEVVVPVVRRLPHWKLSLPYPRHPSTTISFYLDTEVGLWLGYNEPAVITWWRNNITGDSEVFDVGAYIGIYSLLAADCGAARVHAFEPDPNSARRIREQARYNRYANIFVNECAVSDSAGNRELVLNKETRQHSLVGESDSTPRQTVSAITLDEYEADPDLVKVDVEGAADQVIRGAEEIIAREDSRWIIEVHNESERAAIESHFAEYERSRIGDRHLALMPS